LKAIILTFFGVLWVGIGIWVVAYQNPRKRVLLRKLYPAWPNWPIDVLMAVMFIWGTILFGWAAIRAWQGVN